MRYKLEATVALPDGTVIREVVIRQPKRTDQAVVKDAVTAARQEAGGRLSDATMSAILVAHFIDLPIAVVRKFAMRDLCQLTIAVTSAVQRDGST
jgi:hypothetical protein